MHARRSAFLENLLVAICGAPVVAAALTAACGGRTDEEKRPDASSPSAEQTATAPSPFPSSPPASSSSTPRPGTPAFCATPIEREPAWTDCGAGDDRQCNIVCLPLPEDGASCASRHETECILWGYECGLDRKGDAVVDTFPATDACCWLVRGGCAVGRPFTVGDRAREAALVADRAWAQSPLGPDLAQAIAFLDPAVRRTIADTWARDGLAEHASVASFARFVMELLSLGAPPELVSAAQRALGDEIRHAQQCFALASTYAATPCGPGRLDVSGALEKEIHLMDFAVRAASEGCVAETVAALQIHAAANAAAVPAVATLLRTIAEEETEHALLAWRTVRWAIEKGGEGVRRAVADVFARASSHVGFGPCPDESVDPAVLEEHGILTRRQRHDLALAALETVIAPAADALLSGLAPREPAATLELGIRWAATDAPARFRA